MADSGVRNVTRLVHTHQANVIETAGVVTHTTNSTLRDGALVATVRAAAEPNLTRVRYVSRSHRVVDGERRNRTSVIAANGTAVRQYTVAGGNVSLDNTRNRTELFDRALRGLSTAANPLRGTLRRGNFSVADVDERDDATVVTLRADRYAGGQLYDAENVASYDATVRITTDGLIRSATERVVSRVDGNERRYGFTYRFEPRSVDLPRVPQVPAETRVG
ncbi:hypothetical protein HZS55_11415 [Halosimplex rubrum]|uniref:Uncharacterized protein n=1 Tax=Halosimplex rubrum TaxID=869889 RepID=A0A7D5T5M8_9EURY|nr:hypothetical protein [Halosimplex rubrum]QLH77869.1 hypothetical protein HZS55_11415 [Halosimplex rubrum]